ncbi:MAG: response regulator [Patescibacteria group bacterium]
MREEPYKILIVEDEEALSDVLVERFQNEGFNVIKAQDGEQALTMALAEQPDLILLDIVMPKMSGLEMLEKLRADERGKEIMVMMLTNLSDNESVQKAVASNAVHILVKSDWDISSIVQDVRDKLANLPKKA